jgi:FKBP-type peptidyl-prolyl cis-trans isomerase
MNKRLSPKKLVKKNSLQKFEIPSFPDRTKPLYFLAIACIFVLVMGFIIYTKPTSQPSAQAQVVGVSSLMITDISKGVGDLTIKDGSIIKMNYSVSRLDGTVIDSNTTPGRTPYRVKVGSGALIEGWSEGVKGLTEGGKREITIPASQAYGPKGIEGVIDPNTDIKIFVEIVDIEN